MVLPNFLRGFGPSGGGGCVLPNVAVLTVADNGNGTGGVATVTGSSAGSVNTVYVAPWDAPTGNLVFTAFGPRTGDGTVAVGDVPGYYVGFVESVGSVAYTVSNFLRFQLTNAAVYSSVHAALAHAVGVTLQGLVGSSLTGISANSIRVREIPLGTDFTAASPPPPGRYSLPAIVVCYGSPETLQDNVNIRDDITYPILVVMFSEPNPGKPETGDDQRRYWREVIVARFINQYYTVTAGGITRTFHGCAWEPGPVVDWGRFMTDGVSAGSFILRFPLRRPRGLPIT